MIEQEVTNPNGQTKNRRIAILGDWGTGKSTIINMLKNKLSSEEEDRKTCVMVFDLWAHTGDALRRSFLIELYKELDSVLPESKKPKSWAELSNKLSYVENEVTETSWREYRPLNVCLILVVPLIVALNAILEWLGTLFTTLLTPAVHFWCVLACCLIAIGLAYLLGRLVGKRENSDKPKEPETTRLRDKSRQVVSHCANADDSEVHTKTKAQLAWSMRFVEYLDDMMTAVEEACPSMRVLIVLDNLDRLNSENLRNAWNSVQIFANYMDDNSGPAKNMWLILPVSNETVENLLTVDTGAELDSTEKGGAVLSKLFTIQFAIPKPIYTEWREALGQLLRQAFPYFDSQAEQTVITLFNNLSNPECRQNPREQKCVINKLVSLSKVYTNVSFAALVSKVYLDDQCALAKKRGDISDGLDLESWIVEQLTTKELREILPDGLSLDFDSGEIAMLTFGVSDRQRAEEVLLRPILEDPNHLKSFDLNSYREHSSGIWEALQTCVTQIFEAPGIAPEDFEDVENKGMCYIELLQRLKETGDLDLSEKMARCTLLRSMLDFLPFTRWSERCDPTEESSTEEAIVFLVGELDYEQRAIENANKALGVSAKKLEHFDESKARNWAQTITVFFNALLSNGYESDNYGKETIPGTNLGYLLEELAKDQHGAEIIQFLQLRSEETLETLATFLVSSNESPTATNIAAIVAASDLLCEEVKGFAYEKWDSSLSTEQRTAFFQMMCLIHRQGQSPYALTYLKKAADNNGNLASSLSRRLDGPTGVFAALNYLLNSDLEAKSIYQNDAILRGLKESDYLSEGAKLFVTTGDNNYDPNRFTDILNKMNQSSNYKVLCIELLQTLYEEAADSSQFPFDVALRLFNETTEQNNAEFISKMQELYTVSNLMSVGFALKFSRLYVAFLSIRSDEKFENWLRQNLEKENQDAWNELLDRLVDSEASSTLELLDLLYEKDELPARFEQALSDYDANLSLLEEQSLKPLLAKLSVSGFQFVSGFILARFTTRSWKEAFAGIREVLLKRGWFQELDLKDQKTVAKSLIGAHTICHVEWLYEVLQEERPEKPTRDYIGKLVREALKNKRKDDPKDLKKKLKALLKIC